jgi:hypothetical protein
MTPRSIRRAAERKAKKLALKAAKQTSNSQTIAGPLETFEPVVLPEPPDFNGQADLSESPEPHSEQRARRTFSPQRVDLPYARKGDRPSPAQLLANRANAQHSTGPKSEAGKAVSSLNNFRHGLAGKFMVLDWESREEFNDLLDNLRAEHRPATPTETLLVENMTQHYWLRQRAMRLQHCTMDQELPTCQHPKELALYLRYQTTHERAFHKCLDQLAKLRAEKRKTEIGFESRARKQREDTRKEAGEHRKQELHKWNVLFAEAKVEHRALLNLDVAASKNLPIIGPDCVLAAQNAA